MIYLIDGSTYIVAYTAAKKPAAKKTAPAKKVRKGVEEKRQINVCMHGFDLI